jgi:hypothetical protein
MKTHQKCLATLLTLSACTGYALDLKGIQADAPADCPYIKSLEQRQGRFSDSCANGIPEWITHVSFLGGTSPMGLGQDPEGNITEVFIFKFSFPEAALALTEKFGPAKTEESVIQNRLGAKFEQQTLTWEDEKSTLKLSRHGSRIGEPALALTSKRHRAQRIEQRSNTRGNI